MTTDWLSIYWIAPITAWLVAQVLKVVLAMLKGDQSESKPTMLSSGNMPSSHSAITVSLLVVVAALDGVNSAAFGIVTVLTSITIYDALNLRRAVGEQGVALKTVVKDTRFYTALGHRPSEVIVGALIGAFVGFGMLQIL